MTTARSSRALRIAPPDADAAAFGDAVEFRPAPIALGTADTGDAVEVDLEALFEGRLLVGGMSGSGKSWLLRRLLEATADRVQQVVVDPEGEFASLAERYGHLALDASRLDPEALGVAAARARRSRRSLWVDLSAGGREAQMRAAAAVVDALVRAEAAHWHPCFVAVDEAHLLAPAVGGVGIDKRARTASLAAMSDLMGRGRKRGLCAVLATQRLVSLARPVAAEAGNVLLGRHSQDLDITRAALAVGWPRRKAEGILRVLRPGHFIANGPAFSRSPVEVRIGPVATRHRGSTPRLGSARPVEGAIEPIDVEDLAAQSAARALAARSAVPPGEAVAVRRFAAEPGFLAAARVLDEVRAHGPLGLREARLPELARMPAARIEAGLALLERYGLVRFGQAAASRIVEAT